MDFQENRKLTFETAQEEIKKQKAVCERVAQTVHTNGWQTIIQPLIDKTIVDLVGGKIGKDWVAGKISDAGNSDERREFYIGYKQGLIDFNNRVMYYVKEVRNLEAKFALLEKEKTAGLKMPGTDSKYNPEGKDNGKS